MSLTTGFTSEPVGPLYSREGSKIPFSCNTCCLFSLFLFFGMISSSAPSFLGIHWTSFFFSTIKSHQNRHKFQVQNWVILLEDSAMLSPFPLRPPFELEQAPPLPSPWMSSRFILMVIRKITRVRMIVMRKDGRALTLLDLIHSGWMVSGYFYVNFIEFDKRGPCDLFDQSYSKSWSNIKIGMLTNTFAKELHGSDGSQNVIHTNQLIERAHLILRNSIHIN